VVALRIGIERRGDFFPDRRGHLYTILILLTERWGKDGRKDDLSLPLREFQPLHIDETVLNFTKQNLPLHLRNVEQADRKGSLN